MGSSKNRTKYGEDYTSVVYWNAAGTNTATSVYTNKCDLLGVDAQNSGAAVAYLHIYDKATTPTVGTTVPVRSYMLPVGSGIVRIMDVPMTNGLAFGVTASAGAAGSGTIANANEVVVTLDYAPAK